jgi:Zn-dependent protease
VNQPLDIIPIVIALAIILVSLTVHEAAHAWSADTLGDPTARQLGRVSLNPIVHIDPIGTLLVPALTALSGFTIGWAKPVPVTISRLRRGPRDFVLVAAAGPLSNIAQAVVFAVVLRSMFPMGDDGGLLFYILDLAININLYLAVFNLLPIPPLDGGNVLAGLLPPPAAQIFWSVSQFGFLIVIALMYTGILSALIGPPFLFLRGLLIP